MASASKGIKLSFTIDEEDVRYFRNLFRAARKHADEMDTPQVVGEVKKLIEKVGANKKAPHFVREAIRTLEDLIQMLEDEDYELPKPVVREALGALSYFANPHDVIPDHIPGLGYLDDAIMMKLVEEEFKHELRGYRTFRSFRDGSEQRPWTSVARARLPEKLAEKRRELRTQINARKQAEETKQGGFRRRFGW